MRVEVNGEARELTPGATLEQVIREAGVADPDCRGVAVALDGEVVPRSEWAGTVPREGQAVEVLAAIQGGAVDTNGFVSTPWRGVGS